MIPVALAGLSELLGVSGVSQPVISAATSAMLPQLHTLGIHSAQRGFYSHPVMPPSTDALLQAKIRGFFLRGEDQKPDEVLDNYYTWLMRWQGAAVGSKGYNTIDGVNWEPYKTAWQIVEDSQLARPGIREAFLGLISGFISQDEFERMMRRNGALAADWQWLYPFYSNRLSPAELIPLYNRGYITDKEFDGYLQQLQYGVPSDRQRIKAMVKEIPGYQDIVRFAIRESFNPDMVKALGLNLELDQNPDYLDWANASGLGNVTIKTEKGETKTINFAEMYWYAHWDLPSPTQSYQFLHRFYGDSRYGPSPFLAYAPKFEMPDLENLLKANDYSPQFRKHLAGISYPVLTRIDVRRIRKSGIIKKEDVYHNYRAAGYDDQRAHWLTEWVEKDIVESKEKKRQGDFKSRLCKAYTLGTINKDRFREVLIQVKYTPEDASDIIHLCDIDLAYGMTKERVGFIRAGFLSGAYDYTEARLELDNLKLSVERRDQLLYSWQLKLDSRRRVIAAKEVSQWYIDDIISLDDMISRFTKLDYNATDVTRMVQAANLEKSKRLESARKRAADEMQRIIEKNMKAAEKARKDAERLAREREAMIRREAQRLQREADQRLANFLSARTEANLRLWLASEEITEAEVRDTFRLKGWIEADIDRWLQIERERG